ncbi:disulfide bond formation protein B [Minwuia thermotolerans]|nr:disulfide bond formation protein B [Minwuia thermotolerans]
MSLFDRLDARLGLMIAVLAALPLAAALIAQYVFGLAPCPLCVWQRWPYLAALVLGAAAWALGWRSGWLAAAAALCFAASAGVGVFHAGVEEGLWQGLETCTGAGTPGDLDALRSQVLGTQPARCDQVPFAFLGLSIAGWNVVYGGFAAMLALTLAVRSTGRRSR